MTVTQSKPMLILSTIIALLMIVASAGGLFVDGLYRNNTLVTAAFRGNDLVTLVVASPLLLVAMALARRNSQRALLIWMAMLGYALYNYAFYLFGAAFNPCFLIYVALFALSILALIFGLSGIDAEAIGQRFRPGTPVKWISGFMLFFALMLGGMWIAQSLSFVFGGQVPQAILDTEHPTGVVFALDLSLLVPFLVLGAILLWRRQPWGYLLAAILMIKATTYSLALIVMSPFAAHAGVPGAWDLAALWAVLGLASLVAALALLVNLRPAGRREIE